MTKARFAITTITTLDENLPKAAELVRKYGFTHEQIYRAGLQITIEGNEALKTAFDVNGIKI